MRALIWSAHSSSLDQSEFTLSSAHCFTIWNCMEVSCVNTKKFHGIEAFCLFSLYLSIFWLPRMLQSKITWVTHPWHFAKITKQALYFFHKLPPLLVNCFVFHWSLTRDRWAAVIQDAFSGSVFPPVWAIPMYTNLGRLLKCFNLGNFLFCI